MPEIIICNNCGYKTTPSSISAHIKKSHKDLSIKDQIILHQNSILPDAAIKINYLSLKVIDYLIKKFTIKTLADYGKLTYKFIPKWNSYCEMIIKFRDVEFEDLQVFFDIYLPYKKENPKDVNSKKLAEIVCSNHPNDIEEFYRKVLMQRNAYTGHGGELSPWSKDFVGYEHLSDEDKNKARRQRSYCKDREDFNEIKVASNTTLEYYLNQGMNEDEAKLALRKRQSTFSLEKCIEKYGEAEGIKRFKERQEKWLSNLKHYGFSIVSQNLFWKIFEETKLDCIFATNNNGTYDDTHNLEYKVEVETSYVKLDFYIPSLNKWIEFDGDYWHGEKRGNQERDKQREDKIFKAMPGIQLKRIKECDYQKDPEKVINECVDWILN